GHPVESQRQQEQDKRLQQGCDPDGEPREKQPEHDQADDRDHTRPEHRVERVVITRVSYDDHEFDACAVVNFLGGGRDTLTFFRLERGHRRSPAAGSAATTKGAAPARKSASATKTAAAESATIEWPTRIAISDHSDAQRIGG